MTQNLLANMLGNLGRCSCQRNAGHIACSSSSDVKVQETRSVSTEAALSGRDIPAVPGEAELDTWQRETVHNII